MLHSILNKLFFSLWQSLITVGLCLGVGGGLALFEHQLKIKTSRFFNALMMLPVFLPSLMVATGFIIVWGNAGYINSLLGMNLKWLYSLPAIIAAHCFYNVPLAYLAISSRLATAGNYLEEAASVLGASWRQIFTSIIWLRIKNITIGTGVIIFLYSFLSFAIPLVLGGVRFQTLEVYIYNLATQQLNFVGSITVAILQFVLLLILILFFIKHLESVSEKKVKRVVHDKFTKHNFFIWIIRLIIIFFIGLPISALLIKGFITIDVNKLIEINFLQSWLRTFVLASITIIISVGLVLLLLFKNIKVGKYFILWLTLSPIMVGLILFLIFGKSLIIMPFAYSLMLVPLAYYLMASLYESRPAFFDDSLKILGASKQQKIKASLRYLLPAITKAVALGYALVMGDIAISALLAPYKQPTAMKLAYSVLGTYRFSIATTIMSFVLISILAIIVLVYTLTNKYDFENK